MRLCIFSFWCILFFALSLPAVAMHLHWSRIWCYSWHYRSTYNFIIICCMLCYVIECDVQMQWRKSPVDLLEYNLIVDIFQGISNHHCAHRNEVYVCVYAAACKLQEIYWPACARIFKFIIVWCMIALMMYFHFPNVENRIHTFLSMAIKCLPFSILAAPLLSIAPYLFSLWKKNENANANAKTENKRKFYFGIWMWIESSFLFNLMSVEFVCRFIIIIISTNCLFQSCHSNICSNRLSDFSTILY